MTNNISVLIRSEKIIININPINNNLEGKVITSSFVGNSYQYTLSTPIGNLYVVSTDISNYKKLNDEVFLSFDIDAITLLED